LDIYGTHAELKEAFARFAEQIKPGGTLIINKNADVAVSNPHINIYTYSLDGDTDFHAANIEHTGGGIYRFDLVFPGRPCIQGNTYGPDRKNSHYNRKIHSCPDSRDEESMPYVVKNCTLGIPGRINIENAVAAAAMVWAAAKRVTATANVSGMKPESDIVASETNTGTKTSAPLTTSKAITAKATVSTKSAATAEVWPDSLDEDKLREALASFKGVRRRFDFHINTPELVYMDDYAHHPEELRAVITSMKDMFPRRRLTVVFQPHLYTRTRDFYREFAEALSLADEVVLVPVYPAREEPIEGISSQMIGDLLAAPPNGRTATPYRIIPKEMLAQELGKMPLEVLLTAGAGDIENYCSEIADSLNTKTGHN
jgi:UDP-N-acetylmuramate--alanine ligase